MKKLIMLLVLVWVAKSFFTIEDMMRFINQLPLERAMEAKIIVINSQRSFLGAASDPYYLIYRN